MTKFLFIICLLTNSIIDKSQGVKDIAFLLSESDSYLYSDLDSAKYYVLKAIDIEAVNDSLKAEIDQRYSVILRMKGEYDSAEYWQNQALLSWKNLKDTLRMADGLNNLGIIEDEKANNDSAIAYYLEALRNYEIVGSLSGMAKCYNNLGIVNKRIGNHKRVIDYYSQSLEIYERLDHKLGLAITHGNIGSAYLELQNYELSIHHSNEAITRYENENILQYIPYSLENIGIAYRHLGDLDMAQGYHERALDSYLEFGNRKESAFTLNSLAEISLIRGHLKQAQKKALESLSLARETGVMLEEVRALKTLQEISTEMSEHEEAIFYLLQHSDLKDSMNSIGTREVIEELQAKYDSDKKDQEIVILRSEAEIQSLELEFTRLTLIATSIIAILLVLVGFLYFNRYKYKQQSNLLAQKEKDQQLRFRAVVKAEEKERARVARELHDGLGQLLSTVRLGISGDNDVGKKSAKILDTAIDEVRTISHNMMPAALTNLGLIPAIRQMIRSINDADKMKVESILPDDLPAMSDFQKVSIYRIIQEVVNNSLKYSGASNIQVHFFVNYDIEISVNDDGTGFDTSSIANSEGSGWKNIQSRIDMMNGKFFIQSDNNGTKVKLNIPINGEAQAITG